MITVTDVRDRLAYIRDHAETAAQSLQNALRDRDRAVTVKAGPHSLMVYCGTRYLGRVTYEELAESGIAPAANRLIASWADEIVDPR